MLTFLQYLNEMPHELYPRTSVYQQWGWFTPSDKIIDGVQHKTAKNHGQLASAFKFKTEMDAMDAGWVRFYFGDGELGLQLARVGIEKGVKFLQGIKKYLGDRPDRVEVEVVSDDDSKSNFKGGNKTLRNVGAAVNFIKSFEPED